MRSVKAVGTFALLSSTVSWSAAQAATHMFHISASTVPEALAAFQKQSGVGVIAKGADVQKIRVSPVNGMMDDQEALQKLFAQTPLQVQRLGKSTTFVVSAKAVPHVRKSGINDVEGLFVVGHRKSQTEKRTSNIVMDTVPYDPFENLGGNSSVASSLVLLPGVTGIVDGDEPRYVSLRGISPDLNHTTIDGVALASVGETGSGTRRVNLQDIPAEMTSRTNVYKSFTAEQDADAIGGVIDMIPMSAFDHKGLYKYFDGYGIYSSYRGSVGHNNLKGYDPHMGAGAKGTISDTFGKDHQFGLILSSRYQSRVRNSQKQYGNMGYTDTAGKVMTNPEDGNWNGRTAPISFQSGKFANAITTVGGSGKLEWRPTGTNLYASVMGWSYDRWEHSVMDKQDYNLTGNVSDQSDDGGTRRVNSIYLRRRQDKWERHHSGMIGHVDWHRGRSNLVARAGYTWETYDNVSTYLAGRTYPKNVYANYDHNPADGSVYLLQSLTNPSIASSSKYALSTASVTRPHAWEGIPTARLDYTFNASPSAHGFGLVAGFQWRQLTITNNVDEDEYKTGGDMTGQIDHTNYVAWKDSTPASFIGVNGMHYPWSSLKKNDTQSLYDSRVSDYKYRENIVDGYLSLHYRLKNTTFIAGVRVDSVNYSSWTPTISNGAVSAGKSKTNGSYINPLPSFDIVHHLPYQMNLHTSYSRTIGRPTPGNIAQAANISCDGDGGDGGGVAECSITQGNPALKPRRSHNFDISLDKWFNHNQGMFSVAFFSKWIEDDIYTLRTTEMIGDTLYNVRKPMNASSSNIKGVEVSLLNRNMKLLGQYFDASANATWLGGSMNYSNGTNTLRSHHLIYQPDVLVNGAVTWHIPQIEGGMRVTANYSGRYLTSLGTTPNQNSGFGSLFTLNMAFWHQVYKGVSFKYEVMNLANQQPKWLTGDKLQYTSQLDNYGRGVYFHVIIH